MKEDNKQGLLKCSIIAAKALLYLLLAFNIFVLLFYGLIDRGDVLEGISVRYVKDWNVIYGEDGDQTVSAVLPEGLQANEYLYFETRNDVAVYINGELRKDFVEERDVNVPGGSMKRFIMSVPLKASDSGADIVIERRGNLVVA